ncbi:MAG: hypothetical protein AAGG00_05435 [Cyanobacteria bacterium P01_H01_bin.150]
MNVSELTREYGKIEAPDLPPDKAVKKYGSMIRNAIKNPEASRYGTVKRIVEILDAEMIIRVKPIEEMSL